MVCGGLWWFAVVCGGLRWIAVVCLLVIPCGEYCHYTVGRKVIYYRPQNSRQTYIIRMKRFSNTSDNIVFFVFLVMPNSQRYVIAGEPQGTETCKYLTWARHFTFSRVPEF